MQAEVVSLSVPSMPIEFGFRITRETISIHDAGTGFERSFANRIAAYDRHGVILLFGEPDEKARSKLGPWYVEHANEVLFCTLFGAAGAELGYEIQVLEDLTRMLHRQSQDHRGGRHLAAKLANAFDYVLDIPGYEAFSPDRRAALEQTIQAHLRLRRLTINGREVQIPACRRGSEFRLRVLSGWLPVVATAAAYLTATEFIRQSQLLLFIYLATVLLFSYLGGRVLWMLAARRLVPPMYRLCMLQGRRRGLSCLDKTLARIFWATERG